jgi:hypothetical protein
MDRDLGRIASVKFRDVRRRPCVGSGVGHDDDPIAFDGAFSPLFRPFSGRAALYQLPLRETQGAGDSRAMVARLLCWTSETRCAMPDPQFPRSSSPDYGGDREIIADRLCNDKFGSKQIWPLRIRARSLIGQRLRALPTLTPFRCGRRVCFTSSAFPRPRRRRSTATRQPICAAPL